MKSSDNVCTVVENIQPGSVIWAGAVQVEYIVQDGVLQKQIVARASIFGRL